MLYHYTDRITADGIVQAGVIRAASATLHLDMWGKDKGRETPPIVWLTASETPDPTVLAKLRVAGWPLAKGDVRRFVFSDDYPCLTFNAWVNRTGIPPEWFRWMKATARLAKSNVADWRVVEGDASGWLRVEDCDTTTNR